MNEREVRKYLEYAGQEFQYSPNTMGACLASRQVVSRAVAVLVTLFLMGSVSGLMYYGAKHTVADVEQITRNVSLTVVNPALPTAVVAYRETPCDVWWTVIAVGIGESSAVPQMELRAVN